MMGGTVVGHKQFHSFHCEQILQYCSSIYIFCKKFYPLLICLCKNSIFSIYIMKSGFGLVEIVTLDKH